MTSHELARKLLTMPDLPVTVHGYEGGVDIISSVIEPRELILNVNTEWYLGKHEYTDDTHSDCGEGLERILAIHVG